MLLLVVIENNRAILRTLIGALAVEGSGIVGAPEYVEDVGEGDSLGIELDL